MTVRVHFLLVTFLSSCFFFTVFHAVAEAQAPFAPPAPSISYPAFSDLKSLMTPTPMPTATPTPTPIKPKINIPSNLEELFGKYGAEFNIDKEWLKKIAKCESNFNPLADTGLYAGMFQFMAQTWSSTRSSMGLDPNPELRKDAGESIRTAAFMLSKGRQNAWPVCH